MRRRVLGQTAVEYMLAVSVVAVSIAAAFWLIYADNGSPKSGGPAKEAFKNVRDVIESPWP